MHSTVIHPQHSLMLDVRHTLSLLLGHCEGHLMADLTEKQLQLKEETGRMLCRVADVLIPGIQLFDYLMLIEVNLGNFLESLVLISVSFSCRYF